MQRLRSSLLLALLVGTTACEQDVIAPPRPDSGVPARDGGSDEPLALQPGMTFVYEALLTARGEAVPSEGTAQYTLTLTIQTVEDVPGASRLTFSATGSNLRNDDWVPTFDYDSWVGRLGPSLGTDQVGGTGVSTRLDQPPVIPSPPAGGNKALPAPGTFFMDVRDLAQIRADFAETYATFSPQVAEPERNMGKWLFAFNGPDSDIFFYGDPQTDPATRDIRLEYDPRGFLVRLDERIGDARDPPNAATTLTLISGP